MLKYIIVFAFTYVLESFALFYGDFCMDLYSVANDEAMKRGNEALPLCVYRSNFFGFIFCLLFLRFIASIFKQRKTLHRFIATVFA